VEKCCEKRFTRWEWTLPTYQVLPTFRGFDGLAPPIIAEGGSEDFISIWRFLIPLWWHIFKFGSLLQLRFLLLDVTARSTYEILLSFGSFARTTLPWLVSRSAILEPKRVMVSTGT
jgi:hypothetical protein